MTPSDAAHAFADQLVLKGGILMAVFSARLSSIGYQRTLPARWTDLLDELKAFVDPLITSPEAWTSWDPVAHSWS